MNFGEDFSPGAAVPVSLMACFSAWQRALRGKQPSRNQLAFEVRWLDPLQELHPGLSSGLWQGHRTVSFVVSHPKRREIHTPNFPNRVVPHSLAARRTAKVARDPAARHRVVRQFLKPEGELS